MLQAGRQSTYKAIGSGWLKYKSPGGEPGSCTEERDWKLFLASEALDHSNFLLAQGVLALLFGFFSDDNHDKDQCCCNKYFHALRIAWNPESAFCNGLTVGKQICKRR